MASHDINASVVHAAVLAASVQCKTLINPVVHAAASTASVQCQDTDQVCAVAADGTLINHVLLQLTGQ